MKTKLPFQHFSSAGYALLMVLIITVASVLILAGTLNRSYTVAKLNDRSNDRLLCQNAAEAAVEKAFARMQYDFQCSGGGLGNVDGNVSLYQNNPPNTSESAYWGDFQFSDGQTAGKTFVSKIGTFSGALPQAYPGRFTSNAPIYRIMSNVTYSKASSSTVGTAQEDVLLALVPLTTYAIFYNGLLEFSQCATMTVNGPVHGNTNIYVGTSASLTFNSTVTSSGNITAPDVVGQSYGNATNYNSSWNTHFLGTPTNSQYVASIQTAMPMTNSHSIIEMPTSNNWNTVIGAAQAYNQSAVVLEVANGYVTNIIQAAPGEGQLPAADPSPTVNSYPMGSAALTNALPFLTVMWASNAFYDARQQTTNLTTQIDIGKYSTWLTTNTLIVGAGGKYPTGSSNYPTILYVADTRTPGTKQMAVVRLTNGVALPSNGGLGFSVATPNPLYVWGNYNQSVAANLATTNTSSGTVPAALLSDALTILSSSWKDKTSMTSSYSDSSTAWNAASADTVNAAIVTGIVPSTAPDTSHFSGGVQNLPRLLEDWSSSDLWINTSIINLFSSAMATKQFIWPGTTYEPPTRHFSYDYNFSNPSKVPPGIPCALIALRYNWASPPPGVTTYNVTP